MPVGTNATVKALDPDDLARGRRPDHPGQHLPPVPAAGPRAHRAARRPAPVHGLGQADPDRLRRLPGGQPGRVALSRRRRRDLPLAPRRLAASLHARALDRRPGGARARTSRSASTSRCRRIASTRAAVAEATARTHRWAERCLAAHRAARPGAVRHHPGRPRAGSAGRSPRAAIAALPFDGLCIGGLAGDETPAQRRAALDSCVPLLADDPRPRYLMGLGSPHGPAGRGRRRCGHVRLGAAGARRPQRHAVGARRAGSTCATRASWTTRAPIQEGCRCRACRTVLARLSGPSVPGRRAARLPARDLSQPDLHPRLHGRDPDARSRPGRSPNWSAMSGLAAAFDLAAMDARRDTQAGTRAGVSCSK